MIGLKVLREAIIDILIALSSLFFTNFPKPFKSSLKQHPPWTAMDTIVPLWKSIGRIPNFKHPVRTSRPFQPANLDPLSLYPWPRVLGEIRVVYMATSVQKKRRMSPTQPRKNEDQLQSDLQKMANESEPISSRTSGASHQYVPTYRAQLARRGFLVRENLGSGTYSKVKLALDVNGRYGDKVAVKIVDREKAPKDYQEKFLPRELRVWPTLHHLHLIKLLEVFQDHRRVYMVLEYAPGGDVLKYIQDKGSVNEALARKWFMQAADAVRYMHAKDIVHRDLKLENLLLDADNNIKICDFGFVKVDNSGDLSSTYCGSKSYAAPEILLGRPYQPALSDVWAMGVILYIMVTGKMPFDETKGTKSILEEQRKLMFRWPRSKKVSDVCQDLILKMFTWEYNKRPTVHQALSHQWFFNTRKEEDKGEQRRITVVNNSRGSTPNQAKQKEVEVHRHQYPPKHTAQHHQRQAAHQHLKQGYHGTGTSKPAQPHQQQQHHQYQQQAQTSHYYSGRPSVSPHTVSSYPPYGSDRKDKHQSR